MMGYGLAMDLDPLLKYPAKNIYMFAGHPAFDNDRRGGAGVWGPLEPGTGLGYKSNGRVSLYSHRFGPELAFGHTLYRLKNNTPIALIKYANGQTANTDKTDSSSWAPYYNDGNGINQFDHFLTTVRQAFSVQDIDLDGEVDNLIPRGIIWMQSELDTVPNTSEQDAYYHRIRQLMKLFRTALRNDRIPIVIGSLSNSPNRVKDGKTVPLNRARAGQEKFVKEDTCTLLITAFEHDEPVADGQYYRSDAYLRLGELFAKAMHHLESSCP